MNKAEIANIVFSEIVSEFRLSPKDNGIYRPNRYSTAIDSLRCAILVFRRMPDHNFCGDIEKLFDSAFSEVQSLYVADIFPNSGDSARLPASSLSSCTSVPGEIRVNSMGTE